MSDSKENKPDPEKTEEQTGTTRRGLLVGLAAGVGAAALGAAGAAKADDVKKAQKVKSKILARLQEELKRGGIEDPMIYSKGDTYIKVNEYSKGSPPIEEIS